jgi:ABC-type sugar transport system ATPase subunit
VTHDQTEAMTLGDRVVVLDRGRIQQLDTPVAIYERPANTFVAAFIGTPPMNLLDAEYGDGMLRVGGQRLDVPPPLRAKLVGAAGRVIVGLRPEAFVAAGDPAAGGLVAVPDASTREFLGSETLVRARLGDTQVTVRLPGMAPELPARVVAPAPTLHLFAADGGARLGP